MSAPFWFAVWIEDGVAKSGWHWQYRPEPERFLSKPAYLVKVMLKPVTKS